MSLDQFASPPPALVRFPGFLLAWCGDRSRARFHAAMADIGLHPRHFALMNVIASQPGSAQQELVASTRIDPSSMVAVIDELEGLGLVERRPHPEDRRKRAVHLTPEGTKKLAVAGRAAGRLQGEFFAPLTDAEREQLHGLLRKLAGVEPAS